MKAVNVALLGACGWMGKCHSMAYKTANLAFPDLGATPVIRWMVDGAESRLNELAPLFPSASTGPDWLDAVADPHVDLVDICLPDQLHFKVAKAALLAGKHVYCEKPLTTTSSEAMELAELAEARSLVTRVGHNYPRNPAHDRAREIIEAGEIGEIVYFKATMHVDVLADPDTPFMWRCDGRLAPTGVIGDIASHVFSFIGRLMGEVDELIAEAAVVTPRRPHREGFGYGAARQGDENAGETREVTNPDLVSVMCRFRNGARGLIDVSRVASGRRFQQAYEIYGNRGALQYNYDNLNRLHFYSAGDPDGRQGFRAIDVGPENRNFAAFLPVANFGLGYNETKAIEVAEVVRSVLTGTPAWPTFRDGVEIAKLIDACMESSKRRAWVQVNPS